MELGGARRRVGGGEGGRGLYLADCFKESIETWTLLNPRLMLPRDVYDEVRCRYGLLAAAREMTVRTWPATRRR
jgi:hypothetical protein